MTENIPEQIDKVLEGFKIDKKELLAIFSHLKFIEIKKGESFCKAGQNCDKLGILIEGLLMAKFDTDKGKLNISRFFYSPNNMLITSFESFKNKTRTDESIVAIEDSKLFYLTIQDLEQLYLSVPSINKIARHFAEESYIAALQRIHDLQVLNNKERIEKFYRYQQGLFNRITKIHIASYLRVNRNDLTTVIEKLNKTKKAK